MRRFDKRQLEILERHKGGTNDESLVRDLAAFAKSMLGTFERVAILHATQDRGGSSPEAVAIADQVRATEPQERRAYPHLRLSVRVNDTVVKIGPGCNCVLLETVHRATNRHGSYGSIDRCGTIYTDLVDSGDLTDLRSFMSIRAYRSHRSSAPFAAPIPDGWHHWLSACNAGVAAFEDECRRRGL